MKVDWKQVASSPGYKSLKAALIRDIGGNRRNMSGRSKKEMYTRFKWIIARAQHYAHVQNRPLSGVLNEWEDKRSSWWFGHYSESSYPKLGTGKPRNVKHQSMRNYYKTDPWLRRKSPEERFKQIRNTKTREAKFNREHRLGKKPRWSPDRKRVNATYRRIKQQENL